MTAILGLSAFYHDSAAALVVDGQVVAAAQEERFTRIKHDASFPKHAAAFCLDAAGFDADDLDAVAFYDKPLLKFDRYLETVLAAAPGGLRSFLHGMPGWLRDRLLVRRAVEKGLGRRVTCPLVYSEHHESHAASAFLPSPFEEAAILTMDGVGEWATTTIGVGRGNRIDLLRELRFPHSPGLLYSAFTSYCGFAVNSGEYKLMGLAPYGEPRYVDVILERLIDLRDDGSFRMDMTYFDYVGGMRMTSPRFHDLFGGPPRVPDSPITDREMDLAASIQRVVEEIVLRSARCAREVTGLTNLCLAGGVALNCVANGRLLREETFERLWIQPAAGDAGGAIGAALFTWHQLLGKPRTPTEPDGQQGSLLGPRYEDEDIREVLEREGATFRFVEDEDALCREVAERIDAGDVVGWFQGRMEFGPRALGSRSILGDARSPAMQSRINEAIKFRESFRPFAPAALADRASEWFDVAPNVASPYMLLVADVATSRRLEPEEPGRGPGRHGLGRLQDRRSVVPAITHVDGSARLQTVDDRHGRFHRLLVEFDRLTGTPMVVNTSFNVRGEPIVRTPEDALRCFRNTDMDLLVLGRFVLHADEQHDGRTPVAELAERSRGTRAKRSTENRSLLAIDPNPNVGFLRTFSIAFAVFFGLLGWSAFVRESTLPGGLLCGGGLVVGGLGLVRPTFARSVYIAWMTALFPLGWLCTQVLLTLVYVLVVIPIGAFLRWRGHDPMHGYFDPAAATYWANRGTRREAADYLRRY